MSGQGIRVRALRNAAWHERVLEALARLQRAFDPESESGADFDLMLEGYVDLTGADFGLVAEWVVDPGQATSCAITRAVQTRDGARELIVGDAQVGVLKTLMGRAFRSQKPCARRVPARDGSSRSVLAMPILARTGVVAVVGLASDATVLDASLAAALEPYTLTCATSIREARTARRRNRVSKRLRDSERTMRAVLDNIVDAIVTINHDGKVETVNAAAEHIFGYTPGELVGTAITRLVARADLADASLRRFLRSCDPSERGAAATLQGLRKDGSEFPMTLAISEIEVSARRLFVGIARDQTEHRENQLLVERERATNQTLELLIRIDGLTGIANRRHFDEALVEEARRAARNHQPLSLIMCDIDCFKAFNDRYGHVPGDKALTSVAREVEASFQRAGDSTARYGGEEFAVILPNTEHEQALALADMLRQRIWALSIPHGASAVADRVTISAGVATCHPDRRFDAGELVDAADQALYRAKKAGRNRALG